MVSKLKVVRWYDRVKDDIAMVPDACEYYKGVILDGEQYISPVGLLQTLHVDHVGLQHFYGGFLRDAIGVRKYLEELYKVEHAKKYAWFHSPEAKQEYGDLKATEIKNYVDGDDVLWAIKQYQLMAQVAEDNLDNLCDALKTRGYYLSNLLEIKKHNLEYAVVDVSRESVND